MSDDCFNILIATLHNRYGSLSDAMREIGEEEFARFFWNHCVEQCRKVVRPNDPDGYIEDVLTLLLSRKVS